MKRFFIEYEKIGSELVDRSFDLLDDDLFILTGKSDGTLTVDQIASIGKYARYDVRGFASYCKSKKSRLVLEIPETDLDKITDHSLIIECTKLENGKYYEERLDFTPRTIKLIDYGAYGRINIPLSKTNIVVMLPSVIDPEKVFITEKSGVIAIGESTVARRTALNKLTLGGDLYIQTSDEKTLDDNRTWITEVKEVRRDVYAISNKNYFLFDYERINEILNGDLSKADKKYINDLWAGSVLVHLTKDPAMIYSSDASVVPTLPADARLAVVVRREAIEPYLADGIENLPFKEDFTVINQSEHGFSQITLDDALDIPRTYIDPNVKSDVNSVGAKKIHLFYEYVPGTALPKCLNECAPVEFKQVDMTEEGNIIYRKSTKIVQNEHPLEYADSIAAIGNRAFIEITGPNELAIIEELGPLNLLQEFEVTPYIPSDRKAKGATYYVAKPYNPELNTGYGTF